MGEDEDGDELTTVVPSHCLGLIGRSSLPTRRGPTMMSALTTLDQMTTEYRERLEDQDVDSDGVCVLISEWRTRCIASGIKLDTFRTIKKRLLEGDEIKIDGLYVSRV